MQEHAVTPRRRSSLFAVGRSAADGMRLVVLRPSETPVRGPWELLGLVRGSPPLRPTP
jgi:hypothetical protein